MNPIFLLRWWSNRDLDRRSTRARSPGRFFRPRVEALEGRWVPNTYTVVNTLDNGQAVVAGVSGDLRYCISQAIANNGIDIIAFNIPGVGVQQINIGSDLPEITDLTVIDGSTQPGASPGAPPGFTHGLSLIRLLSRVATGSGYPSLL